VSSRLVPEKAIEVILAGYRKSGLTEPLVVVGDGGSSHMSGYEASLRHDAPAGVTFVGRLDRADALALVAGARAVISASRLEGMPMSILETMALGVPLTVSRIPVHTELIGRPGHYFEVDDPEGLAAQLRAIGLESDFSLEATGQSLKAAVAGRVGWSSIAAEYENLYREVTGELLSGQADASVLDAVA
jgi:glycosyltransferase involved in cell wall biosynthesis